MKSPERRDEETITIFTGLLLFAIMAVTGGSALAVFEQAVPLGDRLLAVLYYIVFGAAGLVLIRYVYRHRGR